jgi:hypothetical protein
MVFTAGCGKLATGEPILEGDPEVEAGSRDSGAIRDAAVAATDGGSGDDVATDSGADAQGVGPRMDAAALFDPPCQACAEAHCEPEYTACLTDPVCLAVVQCVVACEETDPCNGPCTMNCISSCTKAAPEDAGTMAGGLFMCAYYSHPCNEGSCEVPPSEWP